MRLAVVSPFVDRRHGTERALAELLERLASVHRCEIHLFSQRVQDLALYPPGGPAGTSGSIRWHRVPSIPGPHVLQFLFWVLANSVARRWFSLFHGRFDLVLSPGINALGADVIVVHAVFARLAELAHRQAPAGHESGLRRLHRRCYYALLTFLERRVYRNPRVSLAAVSPRTALLLAERFGRADARMIPMGVDAAVFSPSVRSERRDSARRGFHFANGDFVLLLIGNDWKNKGLATLIEAVAACRDLPLRVLVVGQEDPESWRQALGLAGLSSRVTFSAPSAEVVDFYAAADCYVSPSLEDSFALPVAEAMASGLPAVTSALAGISSFVTDGVDAFVLASPTDRAQLAQILRRFATERELAAQMGEAAARTASAWTWEAHSEKVWQVLEDALARKAAR